MSLDGTDTKVCCHFQELRTQSLAWRNDPWWLLTEDCWRQGYTSLLCLLWRLKDDPSWIVRGLQELPSLQLPCHLVVLLWSFPVCDLLFRSRLKWSHVKRLKSFCQNTILSLLISVSLNCNLHFFCSARSICVLALCMMLKSVPLGNKQECSLLSQKYPAWVLSLSKLQSSRLVGSCDTISGETSTKTYSSQIGNKQQSKYRYH